MMMEEGYVCLGGERMCGTAVGIDYYYIIIQHIQNPTTFTNIKKTNL